MNSAELKSQGLLERFAQQAAKYENEIADLRVSLTMIQNENEQLRAENESLKLQALNTEVVDEVPQEDPTPEA